ncbi:hypothetical protein AYM39_17240 [Methylomonas sp. DH-1]|nr:hypothetical protein AYM39_17240 [Methylomonas sp. DH-1]
MGWRAARIMRRIRAVGKFFTGLVGGLVMLQALAGSAAVQGEDDPLPFAQARLRKRGGEWCISSFHRFVGGVFVLQMGWG